MQDNLITDTQFDELDLEPELLRGLADAGFTHCTPIQATALPLALRGQDVEGQAQTGTGKTAAFMLAVMNRLLRAQPQKARRANDPRAVVLAPTRELAIQIHRDAEILGKYAGLRCEVVFGGTGYETQAQALRDGVDILIGTPGRLIDYFKQRIFDLKWVEAVVLDEADRMFDLGFIKDIRFVLRRMAPSEQRLNLLFSATLSHRVSELAYEHMNSPEVVRTSPNDVTVDGVEQRLYHVSKEEKIPLLLGVLRDVDPTRTLVFINTKRTAEKVAAYLEANGYRAGLLSGDVPQKKRMQLLQQFTQGELPILVATDVAARGLHIDSVSHVINFDLPQDAEDYVHRIGRTARAGASGDAISFACEEFVFSLTDIEDFIGASIPSQLVADEMLVSPKKPERSFRPQADGPRRSRKGGRGSGRPRGRRAG